MINYKKIKEEIKSYKKMKKYMSDKDLWNVQIDTNGLKAYSFFAITYYIVILYAGYLGTMETKTWVLSVITVTVIYTLLLRKGIKDIKKTYKPYRKFIEGEKLN